MIEMNKEVAIVAGVTGLVSLVAGVFAGRAWGKRAAKASQPTPTVAAAPTTDDKPADTAAA